MALSYDGTEKSTELTTNLMSVLQSAPQGLATTITYPASEIQTLLNKSNAVKGIRIYLDRVSDPDQLHLIAISVDAEGKDVYDASVKDHILRPGSGGQDSSLLNRDEAKKRIRATVDAGKHCLVYFSRTQLLTILDADSVKGITFIPTQLEKDKISLMLKADMEITSRGSGDESFFRGENPCPDECPDDIPPG